MTFGVDVYNLKQLTVLTYCMIFVADDVNSQVANCVYRLYDLRGSLLIQSQVANYIYILYDPRG